MQQKLHPTRIRVACMDNIQIKADKMIDMINQLCNTDLDVSKSKGLYLVISDNGDVSISRNPLKQLLTD